jgi:glycogen(starch) synthase
MKILISADTVGGVWEYTATLTNALVRAGHEVLVAVLGEVSDERLRSLAPGVEVLSRAYRLEWMPDAAADVARGGRWLCALAEKWGADLVHLNQFAYAAEPFAVPTVVVAHSDVLSWFSETEGCGAPTDWAQYTDWVRESLRAADQVVAPSGYQSALLARHYGRAADRVIHNGVPIPPAPLPIGREPVVVTAGRAWDPAKGVQILDEALNDMGGAAPPAHHLGNTTGPAGEHYACRRLVPHGRVGRAEMEGWLGRAAVYVAPSLYEPFGLAPLEAALHGCALLLSDIGSFRELWDGCAEFFAPGDSQSLREALAGLVAAPDRCSVLAATARERALRCYSADRMVGDYLALYQELHTDQDSNLSERGPVRAHATFA